MITYGVKGDLFHELRIIQYSGKMTGLGTQLEAWQTLTTALLMVMQQLTQVLLKIQYTLK